MKNIKKNNKLKDLNRILTFIDFVYYLFPNFIKVSDFLFTPYSSFNKSNYSIDKFYLYEELKKEVIRILKTLHPSQHISKEVSSLFLRRFLKELEHQIFNWNPYVYFLTINKILEKKPSIFSGFQVIFCLYGFYINMKFLPVGLEKLVMDEFINIKKLIFKKFSKIKILSHELEFIVNLCETKLRSLKKVRINKRDYFEFILTNFYSKDINLKETKELLEEIFWLNIPKFEKLNNKCEFKKLEFQSLIEIKKILKNYYENLKNELIDTLPLINLELKIKKVPPFLEKFWPLAASDNFVFYINQKILNQAAYNNQQFIKFTFVHEFYPGHSYQYKFVVLNSNPIFKLLKNSFFYEGWSLYWEDKIFKESTDEKEQFIYLKFFLLRVVRGLFDIAFNCSFSLDKKFLSKVEKYFGRDYINYLKSKVLIIPTVYVSYVLGYFKFLEIEKNFMNVFKNKKEFYAFILNHGELPFSFLIDLIYNIIKK
ncbi:MAG: DUF885 domain-containing protein [Candidatus Omnitrophica bacterium]|nr:DUF885 domain-containing protein [Candidatus Omnitrophota bacterium]